MDTALLPREIVFPILELNIHTISLYRALNLRLLCREVNEEVSRYIFSDGLLDERILPAAKDCRTCQNAVRLECSTRAINKSTVRKYIKPLLKGRGLSKRDSRRSILASMTTALQNVRQQLQPPRQAYTTMFTHAIITLLGVRNTWSWLGPHHDTCPREHIKQHLLNRSPLFWTLVCATYAGDRKLIQKCLKELNPPTFSQTKHILHMDFAGFQNVASSAEIVYVESLAAAYTVAVRTGSATLCKLLDSQKYSNSNVVLSSVAYFNDLPVFDVALMATESSKEVVASTAVEMVRRFLLAQDRIPRLATHVHARAITHVPLSSGILEHVLEIFLPSMPSAVRSLVCSHFLCRAALTDDVKLATFINEIMQSVTPFEYRHIVHSEWRPPTDWTDECGVRQDRLLDCLNPIQVALACSNLKVLRYLLKLWPSVRSHTHWKDAQGDRFESSESYRTQRGLVQAADPSDRNTRLFLCADPRLQAVRAVFNRTGYQTAGSNTRPAPSVHILDEILTQFATDPDMANVNLGPEVVEAAGVADPDVFQTWLSHVDLGQHLPHTVLLHANSLCASKHCPASIGERAFRHAYQQGRVENLRILLAEGLRPPSNLRGPSYYEDEVDKVANAQAMHDLLREYNIVSTERTMKVPYLLFRADVDSQESQAELIERIKEAERLKLL